MSTLTAIAPTVKPAPAPIPANPRDSWTDADRWELDEAEEPRPTVGPDFTPSAEEEGEAASLLNDDEPTDAYWDARAQESAASDAVCSGHYAF